MNQERLADFLRAVARTEAGQSFARADIVAAFEARDTGSRIVIDTRNRPNDGTWFSVHVGTIDEVPPAEVTFTANSETYDKVLRGEVGIMYAIASRHIAAEGKVPRAMRLVPAFESCLPLSR